MRTITDHKVNGLNEAIEITADNPGPGGASHNYEIDLVGGAPNSGGAKIMIHFQLGPIKESGFNGITNEVLLAVVIDRLRGFQYEMIWRGGINAQSVAVEYDTKLPGKYACRENAIALTHLEEALMWLQKRTRDRMTRGVEGTNVV